MASTPLTPPSVEAAGRALAPVAPETLEWPTIFDEPEAVDRAWLEFVAGRESDERVLLQRGLTFARTWHGDQTRRGGLAPYWVHPVRVAMELSRWNEATPDRLMAALLHDTVEDTEATIGEIRVNFGHDVATLVSWLTAPPSEERAALAAYYERMKRDAPDAVIVLKLADRSDNLRSIQALVMRTGEPYRRWAGLYLASTQRQILPLTGRAPSVARAGLLAAIADLAPFVSDFTEG